MSNWSLYMSASYVACVIGGTYNTVDAPAFFFSHTK